MSFFAAGGMVSWANACIKKRKRIKLSDIILMVEDIISNPTDFFI